MIVDRFIYTRTKSDDYRWIIPPKSTSDAAKSILNTFSTQKDILNRSKEDTYYFLSFTSNNGAVVFLYIGRFDKKDTNGRYIYYASGITFEPHKNEISRLLLTEVARNDFSILRLEEVEYSFIETDNIKSIRMIDINFSLSRFNRFLTEALIDNNSSKLRRLFFNKIHDISFEVKSSEQIILGRKSFSPKTNKHITIEVSEDALKAHEELVEENKDNIYGYIMVNKKNKLFLPGVILEIIFVESDKHNTPILKQSLSLSTDEFYRIYSHESCPKSFKSAISQIRAKILAIGYTETNVRGQQWYNIKFIKNNSPNFGSTPLS